MWTCPKCGEQHDDQFDACWKCTPPPKAVAADSARVLDCLRCKTRLEYAGKKKFHEGSNWGFIGGLGELLVNRETFHFYCCPNCGKAEFFVD